VLVLETDKCVVAYLSGCKVFSIPLAKTGDSDRRQMLSEYALEARSEEASGGVSDNRRRNGLRLHFERELVKWSHVQGPLQLCLTNRQYGSGTSVAIGRD
jgi:hypothetical protein